MNSEAVGGGDKPLQRRPSLKFTRKSFRSKKARQQMAERACSELALEGERLCREGDWEEGIKRLEAATKTGATEMKTLSALYSQLGNAYFYMEEYSKALEYHKQDLTLARSMNDRLGEAKACGNIGSTLKSLGQFDESIACCRMQLDLARGLGDKVLESRALYNLGNVYHARGKNVNDYASGFSQQDIEDFVRASLEQACRHYEANLRLVRELGDQQAQGRTVGNLGNTHYLLGNYKKAIKYHEERLSIAEVLDDKLACRRAYSNLGNAHVFLGKYSAAAQYYLSSLEVSKELNDSAFEAQSCYSLGNTFTLMHNYTKAVEYHTKHLRFATELEDRVGTARACWSLGNAYSALGDHRQARHYAHRHLQLSMELADQDGVATARQNLADLDAALQLSDKYECVVPSPKPPHHLPLSNSVSWSLSNSPGGRKKKLRTKLSNSSVRSEGSGRYTKAQSPDSRSECTASPTSSLASSHDDSSAIYPISTQRAGEFPMDEGFLELISKTQGRRMDDQRTNLPASLEEPDSSLSGDEGEDLFEALWRVQSTRIEDQRCDMASAPHVMPSSRLEEGECVSSDELFEMIFASQSARINDQRSPDPIQYRKSTMPSEDFFNLIQHLQSTRIEDQRSPLPFMAS